MRLMFGDLRIGDIARQYVHRALNENMEPMSTEPYLVIEPKKDWQQGILPFRKYKIDYV